MVEFSPDKKPSPLPTDRERSEARLPLDPRISALRKVLDDIQLDARYLAGLPYGRIRRGHPEGSIETHIKEVAENVDLLFEIANSELAGNLPEILRLELLIAVHVHDTFKGVAKKGARIDDPESHASLARAFLAEFTDDPRLLSCVQNHDVPYSMYRNSVTHGGIDRDRLDGLLRDVADLHLFTLFQIADNSTIGKLPQLGEGSPTSWFIEHIRDHLRVDFAYQEVLARVVETKRRLH
jgi:hypothetical protein